MTSHLHGSLIAVARTPHLAKTSPLRWHDIEEIMQSAVGCYPLFVYFLLQFSWESSSNDVPSVAACCSDLGLNEDIFPGNATLPKGFALMFDGPSDTKSFKECRDIIIYTVYSRIQDDQHRPYTSLYLSSCHRSVMKLWIFMQTKRPTPFSFS